jgi:hypothetical protein
LPTTLAKSASRSTSTIAPMPDGNW